MNNTPPRLPHMHMNNQNFNNNPANNGGASNFVVPHPPATPRNVQQSMMQHYNNTDNNNYDFTLQWRNEHFGAQSQNNQQQQPMEPDSTAIDKDLESLMVNGMASLNTQQNTRPKTNMAINRMDSLMNSYAEENKYFEFNAVDRYQ